MTLVLGVRFQDGVGISGDTRAVLLDDKGCIKEKWDDFQKVYYLPPFLIAISGNVRACSLLLLTYLSEVFDPNRMHELESMALDSKWITHFFESKYKQLFIHEGLSPPVGLIIAFSGRTSKLSIPSTDKIMVAGKPTIEQAARLYYRGMKEVESMVVSIELPSGLTQVASQGEVLMMGCKCQNAFAKYYYQTC